MAKPQATTPSSHLDAQIMSFLGITQQPFTSSILSGDAIYTDATRDQMIATLRHHMQFSDLVLVIEGEQGSGKTTLFRQLIQNDIPNLFLISIQAEATDTLSQLQQKMIAHLKGQGSANYLDQDLKNLQVFDQFPIAIIDDAHVLSDTTLQELIRYRSLLKHDKETNLKILLFANPGMAETLEDISDLQHNQLYVQQMPTLNPKQIQAFLDHRLHKAGYRGDALLPPDTIQQIHKKSQGKPGQVMAMAVLMIEKHVRNFNRSGASAITKFLAVTTFMLLAGIGVYYWLTQTPTAAPPVITINTPEIEIEAAADEHLLPAASEPDMSADADPLDDTLIDHLAPVNPAPELLTQTDEPPAPVDLTRSGIAPPVTTSPVATPANSNATHLSATAAAPQTHAAPVIPAKPPVAEVKPVPTPAPLAAPVPTPAPPIAAVQPAAPVVAKAPPIAEKPTVAPATLPAEAAELAKRGIKDSEWLRTQDPVHWTLQLLGARDMQTVVKYVRAHKLGDDCAWYTTQLNGKPWYVLVHRFYTNADSARKGLELLPASMQRGQPWVKSIAAIQKDLAKPR